MLRVVIEYKTLYRVMYKNTLTYNHTLIDTYAKLIFCIRIKNQGMLIIIHFRANNPCLVHYILSKNQIND